MPISDVAYGSITCLYSMPVFQLVTDDVSRHCFINPAHMTACLGISLTHLHKVQSTLESVQRKFKGPSFSCGIFHCCAERGLPFRPMPTMEVLSHGNTEDLCRPCLDCGLYL